jgi:hypothetical protein
MKTTMELMLQKYVIQKKKTITEFKTDIDYNIGKYK